MKNKPMLAIFVTILIDLLGFGLVIPILPNFAKSIGATALEVGIIAGVYSLMNFIFANFWGTLSDRIGRRPVILVSVLITAASYVLFGFTSNLFLLFLSRLLAGVGSANFGAAQAYISDISTPEERPRAMGMLGAAFGLGFIFGPLVGGLLKVNYGIEGVGLGAAGLCVFNFVLAWFMLPESIKQKNTHREFKFAPVGDLVRQLQKPLFRELFIANFLFVAAFSIMQITSSMLWKDQYELDDAHVGYMFMFIGVASALVQGGLVGRLSKMFSARKLILYGIGFMTTGLVILPFAPMNYFYVVECIGLFTISLANGFLTPTLSSTVSRLSPPQESGRILGLNQSMASLSRVVGPLLGGFVYGYHHAFPFIVAALLMMVCLYVMVHFFRDQKHLH